MQNSNRFTMKVSYSCLPNIKTDINRHNSNILNNNENPPAQCQEGVSLPMWYIRPPSPGRTRGRPPPTLAWPVTSNQGGQATKPASGTRGTETVPNLVVISGALKTRTSPTTSSGTYWGGPPATTLPATNVGCAFLRNFVFFNIQRSQNGNRYMNSS